MRRRVVAFGAVTATCVAVATGTTVASIDSHRAVTAPAPKATVATGDALASALAAHRPLVVFRDLDRARYGRVSFAELRARERKHRSGLVCDRVHFAATAGLCVVGGNGLLNSSKVRFLNSRLGVQGEVEVAGVPSRARVSPDGRLGSVTTFVGGHSYATPGAFSTSTTLFDLRRRRKLSTLERFTTVDAAGRRVTARDRNYWGVTFARDGRTFYATVAYSGRTHLIRGDVRTRRARIIHDNVECPSLSPDETRIGYKKLVATGRGSPRIWHFTVLELSNMRETPLAEPMPRDDQLEWLGDDRVLYGNGEETWTTRADGSGHAERWMAKAGSPAVVR